MTETKARAGEGLPSVAQKPEADVTTAMVGFLK